MCLIHWDKHYDSACISLMKVAFFHTQKEDMVSVNFSARKIQYEIKNMWSFSVNIVHAFLSMDYNNHNSLYSIQRGNSLVKGHESWDACALFFTRHAWNVTTFIAVTIGKSLQSSQMSVRVLTLVMCMMFSRTKPRFKIKAFWNITLT